MHASDRDAAAATSKPRSLLNVVIVNYRTPALVLDCLHSLADERTRGTPFVVTVVDNASSDGSADRIEARVETEGWQPWVTVAAQPANGGFGAGNNVAIRRALASGSAPEFFLLLNPDTVVREGAIEALIQFAQCAPEAGIFGTRLESAAGTVQRSAFRFPNLLGEIEGAFRLGVLSRWLAAYSVWPPAREEPHATDWVAGASMLIRREVFETIGLFDEDFFLYFEEVDFCRRARAHGFSCWYVPGSRVVHLVGRSSGVTREMPTERRPAYWFASRHRYFRKHHGRLYVVLADLIWVAGHASWRLRRRIQGKPDPDPPRLLLDFLRHSLGLKRPRT